MWCRLRAGEWAPAASPHRIKSTRPVEVDILLGQPCPTLAEGLIHVHRHGPQQLGFRHLAAAAAQRQPNLAAAVPASAQDRGLKHPLKDTLEFYRHNGHRA